MNERRRARWIAVLAVLTLLASLVAVTTESDQALAGDGSQGWALSSDGSVSSFGGAPLYGDATGLGSTAVAIVATPSGAGYYIALANGTIVARGDAVSLGDASAVGLTHPIVDMILSSSGHGYILLAADGGVFVYGNLTFHGSVPQIVPADQLQGNAVALLSFGGGSGYAIVFDDGGVFNFGTSSMFYGSVPGLGISRAQLAGLIVGAVPAADGAGYGLIGSDGGVFAFGSYSFLGSSAASGATYAAIDTTDDGGYVLASTAGTLNRFPGGGGPVIQSTTSVGSGLVGLALRSAASGGTTTTTAASTSSTGGTTSSTGSTTSSTTTTTSTTTAPASTSSTSSTTTSSTTTSSTTTTTSGGGGPAGAQFSVWNGIRTSSVNQGLYWNINAAGSAFPVPNFPSNSHSPVDYVNGNVYARVQVFAKESTRPFLPQFCVWNSGFTFETCADESFYVGQQISVPGTYYYDLGTPNLWWKLNGVYSWAVRPDHAQVMVKDGPTRSLVMSSGCGGACFTGGDVSLHDEMTFSVEVIFVQAGAGFQPPGSWAGSPWS